MPSESPVPAGRLSPRLRVGIYAAALVAVGQWACFHQLDRGMLVSDEAWFAYTTEHMLGTGDYVVPSIGDEVPHLNAAPLYNWLCCLTADWVGEGALRYRLWSAAFGVGCALAALLLGAVLFAPEVGFLAGLFLLTNNHFLNHFGVREGRMDPGLAFFVTLAVVTHARACQSAGRGIGWWTGTGACLGLAALMKPPAFAGFFFTVFAAHHLLTRHDLSFRSRAAGPAAGALAAVAVALPWYAAIYARLGTPALRELFVSNSVGRAVSTYLGMRKPPEFYLTWIWRSSWAFKLMGAAFLWAVVCVGVGWRRSTWGLLGVTAGVFLVAVTAAATRHPQYVYPIFPVVAVMIAALLLGGWVGIAPGAPWDRWRLAGAVVGFNTAVLLLAIDIRTVCRSFARPLHDYPPLVLHREAEADLASGRARLVLYRYPVPGPLLDISLGFTASERIYPFLLPHAVRAETPAELDRLLADGTPTVVFLPPRLAPPSLVRVPATRVDFVSRELPYPALAFNGGEATFRLHEIPAERLAPSAVAPTIPSNGGTR